MSNEQNRCAGCVDPFNHPHAFDCAAQARAWRETLPNPDPSDLRAVLDDWYGEENNA